MLTWKEINTWLLRMLISIIGISTLASEGWSQGPPINTDTPIMIGVNGRGIRTFVKFVRMAKLLQDGEEITDDMDRRVTVRVTPFAFPYNLFDDRFQLGVILPFMNINRKTLTQDISSFGIGDVRIFAKYLLYQFDRKNKTIRIASKVGIKLPSGNENKVPALGSGSTDYFFTTVAGWIEDRIGVFLEGIYNVNTSKGQMSFGNSFSYNLAFGYRLLPVVYKIYPSPQLNSYLEINGTTANKNKVSGRKVDNSGGTTIFLSPGLQYVGGRRWLVETTFQYPIVNEPNGTQLATNWSVSLGTRILLF